MSDSSPSRIWSILRNALPLAGLVLVFCIAFFGEQGLMANRELRDEMTQLHAEIEELRMDNAELREQVREMLEDPVAIEKTVREEMFMVSKDQRETLFVFGEDDVDRPSPDE